MLSSCLVVWLSWEEQDFILEALEFVKNRDCGRTSKEGGTVIHEWDQREEFGDSIVLLYWLIWW